MLWDVNFNSPAYVASGFWGGFITSIGAAVGACGLPCFDLREPGFGVPVRTCQAVNSRACAADSDDKSPASLVLSIIPSIFLNCFSIRRAAGETSPDGLAIE